MACYSLRLSVGVGLGESASVSSSYGRPADQAWLRQRRATICKHHLYNEKDTVVKKEATQPSTNRGFFTDACMTSQHHGMKHTCDRGAGVLTASAWVPVRQLLIPSTSPDTQYYHSIFSPFHTLSHVGPTSQANPGDLPQRSLRSLSFLAVALTTCTSMYSINAS